MPKPATKHAANPAQTAVEPSIESTPVQPTASAKPEGKGALIMRLIGQDQGATLAEIISATNWLPHSVRRAGSSRPPARSAASSRSRTKRANRRYRLVD